MYSESRSCTDDEEVKMRFFYTLTGYNVPLERSPDVKNNQADYFDNRLSM